MSRWTLRVAFDRRESQKERDHFTGQLDEDRFVEHLAERWGHEEALKSVNRHEHVVAAMSDTIDALVEPLEWLMMHTVPRKAVLTRSDDA